MRTAEEITSQILRSAFEGATQTTMMFKTYLPHDTLKARLKSLVDEGLVEYISVEKKYRTTPKGRELLAKAGEAITSCSHQCKKCGMLYQCGTGKCINAFHHGTCVACGRSFSLTDFADDRNLQASAGNALVL